MIKFFRNIRYTMINQKRTSKYLKYAIGEIVLVVIGILIALQINNWNAERENHITADYLLNSLHEDLENDIIELKSNIHDAEMSVQKSQLLQNYYLNPEEYSNGIQSFLKDPEMGISFDLNNITYSEMLSTGTINLLSRGLRKAITHHYWYIESFDDNRDMLLQLKRNINQLYIENGCPPHFFTEEELKIALNDKRLRAVIKEWETAGKIQVDIHSDFMKKTEELIDKIKTELN